MKPQIKLLALSASVLVLGGLTAPAVVAQEEGGQLCELHPAGRTLPPVQLHKYVAFPLPMWYIT